MNSKEQVIEKMGLTPITEGGYCRRVWESKTKDSNSRKAASHIYYLLTDKEVSKFHALDCDEIWHFYSGELVYVHTISQAGDYQCVKLGDPFQDSDAMPSFTITAGTWMAAEIISQKGLSLIGCTCVPEYVDIVMADVAELIQLIPEKEKLIERLT